MPQLDRPRGTLPVALARALDAAAPIATPLHISERMAQAGLCIGSATYGGGLLACCWSMERARGRDLTVSELRAYVYEPLADLVDELQESGDADGFKHLPEALAAVAREIVVGHDGLFNEMPVELFGERVRGHMHDELRPTYVRW